jgi:transketolase
MFGHHLEEYIARFQAFGFETVVIDGNNLFEVDKALELATRNSSGKPYAIISRTFKGKGISFLEDKEGWHGKPLKKEDLEKALSELGEVDDTIKFQLRTPHKILLPEKSDMQSLDLPHFLPGEEIATREIYGRVLSKIAEKNKEIYVLDADVKNSTFSQNFSTTHPDKFIECYIAEQNMVSVAAGLARLGKIPFVATFAAFLTRAADQIRMARVSNANIKFVGSHVGVSIGEDGPSQMGLEDIALFGTLPDSLVLQPADAVTATKLLPQMAAHTGIAYMRTLRPPTPVLYKNDEEFPLGGSKLLRHSPDDLLTIVTSGITVFEALKAARELQKEGIEVRVLDCYSIKPIDKKALQQSLAQTKQKILITVEDHFEHGGLGDFVLSALSDTPASIYKLAVKEISQSGSKEELLGKAGINAIHIAAAVRSFVQ